MATVHSAVRHNALLIRILLLLLIRYDYSVPVAITGAMTGAMKENINESIFMFWCFCSCVKEWSWGYLNSFQVVTVIKIRITTMLEK